MIFLITEILLSYCQIHYKSIFSTYIYIYIYHGETWKSISIFHYKFISPVNWWYFALHKIIYIYLHISSLVKWVECSPMVQETWVQSQVVSYQRLEKWYLILPCLTLSNIRYVSRVKWSNPGKGVTPSPTSQCCSYWKGSLLVALDYSCQLYLHIL